VFPDLDVVVAMSENIPDSVTFETQGVLHLPDGTVASNFPRDPVVRQRGGFMRIFTR
jgi:hypothetical protein